MEFFYCSFFDINATFFCIFLVLLLCYVVVRCLKNDVFLFATNYRKNMMIKFHVKYLFVSGLQRRFGSHKMFLELSIIQHPFPPRFHASNMTKFDRFWCPTQNHHHYHSLNTETGTAIRTIANKNTQGNAFLITVYNRKLLCLCVTRRVK